MCINIFLLFSTIYRLNLYKLTINNYIIAEKLRELATCQSEIKALRSTESLKDKAIEEVRSF